MSDQCIKISKQPKINVVSAIMGAGKSSAIIQRINENPPTHRRPVLIVLPYLKEVQRFIKEVTSVNLIEPDITKTTDPKTSKNKSEDLESMLEAGDSIVATHALFELMTPKAKRLIAEYEIILDEVVGCIKPMNDIKPTTIIEMLRLKLILVDHKTKQISRNWAEAPEGYDSSTEHNRVLQRCKIGTLYILGDNKMFVRELPADLFTIAKKYTILTFQFDHSELKYFFDIKGIKWAYDTELVGREWQANIQVGMKDLITYVDHPTKTAPATKKLLSGNTLMTKTWHEKLKPKVAVATKIRNFYSNSLKGSWNVKPEELLYTGPKDWCSEDGKSKAHLKLKSYRTFTDADGNKQNCWVAFNTKGTNDFANRNFILFNYKLCPVPTVIRYFQQQTERKGLEFDTKAYQDAYALNHMIQFIWRSAIRNKKPIRLHIANPVMKLLFQEWVDKMDAEGWAYLGSLKERSDSSYFKVA